MYGSLRCGSKPTRASQQLDKLPGVIDGGAAAAGLKGNVPNSSFSAVKAVSYTHLDVYKRQPHEAKTVEIIRTRTPAIDPDNQRISLAFLIIGR